MEPLLSQTHFFKLHVSKRFYYTTQNDKCIKCIFGFSYTGYSGSPLGSSLMCESGLRHKIYLFIFTTHQVSSCGEPNKFMNKILL